MRAVILFGIVLLCACLMMASVEGAKTMMIDATEADYDGENQKKVFIGELKHNWQVEVTIKNLGEVNNISGRLLKDPAYFYYDIFNETDILLPGESAVMKYTYPDVEPIDIKIEITSYFNYSAYTDVQTSVLIEYKIKIYDDRGTLIVDSEDSGMDDSIVVEDDEDEGGGCGGTIILAIGIVGCTAVVGKKRRLNGLFK